MSPPLQPVAALQPAAAAAPQSSLSGMPSLLPLMMFMGRQRKGQGSSPAFDPYQCAATCAAQQGFCPKPENPVKPLKSPFDLVSMLQLGDELGLGAMPHAAAPASRPLPALPSLSPQATTPFNVGAAFPLMYMMGGGARRRRGGGVGAGSSGALTACIQQCQSNQGCEELPEPPQ